MRIAFMADIHANRQALATDPAAALLDYARMNRVDRVVMGARANSARRTLLGSVSQEVVAKAPCSVTVVRPPRSFDEVADGLSGTP
jgi:nucleotide-binding universal stress UspA family protein